jgi:N-acetylglucosaminyldiphosphoundecaprenol N-acetyl-beta-D-mannosaminyltransferase
MTTPDGMSIVWLARWMGYSGVDRVYGPDLMRVVCQRSVQEGWRHFLYGGAPGVAEQLADRLRDQFPNLQIVGCYTPPFRLLTEEEDSRVVQYIRSLAPHIVWVGISTPKQERWMAEHLHTLDVPVLIGVGAAFDFLAGVKKQAPRWIQRSGMEWLFRLASEPRRLWKRYAQYPLFGLLVLLQILGIKKYPLE